MRSGEQVLISTSVGQIKGAILIDERSHADLDADSRLCTLSTMAEHFKSTALCANRSLVLLIDSYRRDIGIETALTQQGVAMRALTYDDKEGHSQKVESGDWVTIEALHAWLYPKANLPLQLASFEQNEKEMFKKIRALFDRHHISFKLNADSPDQMKNSAHLGLDIGLIRTENLISEWGSDGSSMQKLQDILFAKDLKTGIISDQTLYTEFQTAHADECQQVFDALNHHTENNHATFRLFDTKHEFAWRMPFKYEDEHRIAEARKAGINVEELYASGMYQFEHHIRKALKAYDGNTGLGLKDNGGFYKAQVRAILDAAHRSGYKGQVEIMAPCIQNLEETQQVKAIIEEVIADMGDKAPNVRFGIMIETDEIRDELKEIAPLCDFVS